MSAEAGTAPNATVTFAAFKPCMDASLSTTWYLTDTRAGGNSNTYKVRMMHDGHIWMVQDMKFGNCSNAANPTFLASSASDKQNEVWTNYYGDCTATTITSTGNGRGYLYDWAAAMNKANAYYGFTSAVGCFGRTPGTSGTAPGACQGICPEGWHLPTSTAEGEFQALDDAIGNCVSTYGLCWNASSMWEGVYGGVCNEIGELTVNSANYWGSSDRDNSTVYYLYLSDTYSYPSNGAGNKARGRSVRCVRNY
jgi:uncharacterized protein (TIGR02145 family)